MAALMQEIPFADQIHMIPFSAVKGDGVEQLRAIIDEIAQDDAESGKGGCHADKRLRKTLYHDV